MSNISRPFDILNAAFIGWDEGADIVAGYQTPTRPEHEPAPEPEGSWPPDPILYDCWPWNEQ